uniref:Saposin-like type B domin-containing protein n=1 Tax=Trepomonas sp. PC1 TaxID=1076344 RepID=A0A146KGJ1_9EUKA|eukprot:JAP94586.1 Saposin-like type B domin-containing protein [Trepomonas sp. PC1]
MLFLVNSLAVQNKFFCDVCEIIVEGVYETVQDPTNVHDIEIFLDQVCDILPYDMFNWCEKIIAQYYEELIHNIINGYPPRTVCQNIGIC